MRGWLAGPAAWSAGAKCRHGMVKRRKVRTIFPFKINSNRVKIGNHKELACWRSQHALASESCPQAVSLGALRHRSARLGVWQR